MQWHYLGSPYYPLAIRCLDAVVSTRVLTPPEDYGGPGFVEGLTLLPRYMAPLLHPPPPPYFGREAVRAKMNFGEHDLVIACFNQVKKIEAPLFQVWAQVLVRVAAAASQGSGGSAYLWLPLSTGVDARRHLEAEAASAGLPPASIVFSPRVSSRDEHLWRLSAADIALDTTRYSAGSVALEALGEGVPLVTLAGYRTVAARQGTAVASAHPNQQLLIAHSFKEYADVSVALLTERTWAGGRVNGDEGGASLARSLERAATAAVEMKRAFGAAGKPRHLFLSS